jgi:hypothetical protein
MPCFVIRIGVADKPAFNFAESLQGFFACRGICRVVEVGHNYQKDRKMGNGKAPTECDSVRAASIQNTIRKKKSF